MLIGGTLIEAHYYKKWIPWDGDVDLMINESDYTKLKKVIQNELPSDIWYQDTEVDKFYKNSAISKIRYLHAFYEGGEKYRWHGGLQIDIIPFKICDDILIPAVTSDIKYLKDKFRSNDVYPITEIEFEGLKIMTFNNYKKLLHLRYHGDKDKLPETNDIPLNHRCLHEGRIIHGVPEFYKKLYPELYPNKN